MELLREWWAVITGAVLVLAWCIRLEALVMGNQREIQRLWVQRDRDLDAAVASRREDRAETLQAREELAKLLAEMRSDIKLLLARDHR